MDMDLDNADVNNVGMDDACETESEIEYEREAGDEDEDEDEEEYDEEEDYDEEEEYESRGNHGGYRLTYEEQNAQIMPGGTQDDAIELSD
jgi:hypothetical protein